MRGDTQSDRFVGSARKKEGNDGDDHADALARGDVGPMTRPARKWAGTATFQLERSFMSLDVFAPALGKSEQVSDL